VRKNQAEPNEKECKMCGKVAKMVTQEQQFCGVCVEFYQKAENFLYWTKEMRDRFDPKGNAPCYQILSFEEGKRDKVNLHRKESKGTGSKSRVYLMVERGGEWITAFQNEREERETRQQTKACIKSTK